MEVEENSCHPAYDQNKVLLVGSFLVGHPAGNEVRQLGDHGRRHGDNIHSISVIGHRVDFPSVKTNVLDTKALTAVNSVGPS